MQGDFLSMTFLEGRNVVVEALLAKRDILEVLIDKSSKGSKVEKVLSLCRKRGIPVRRVEGSYIRKLSRTKNSQGVIARAHEMKKTTLKAFFEKVCAEKENPSFILLKEVSYEQNLGAVLRVALGASIDAVVLPPKFCRLTPTVERTSMGASNYVPLIGEGFYSALKFFKNSGFKIFAVEKFGQKDYFNADLTGSAVLVFGGEDNGLDERISEKCDEVLKIPLGEKLHSLNLSVSVALVAYEKMRQEVKNNNE